MRYSGNAEGIVHALVEGGMTSFGIVGLALPTLCGLIVAGLPEPPQQPASARIPHPTAGPSRTQTYAAPPAGVGPNGRKHTKECWMTDIEPEYQVNVKNSVAAWPCNHGH